MTVVELARCLRDGELSPIEAVTAAFDRIRALDGVVSTETFLYLDMVKQLYDWGTHVDGEKT